MAHWEKRTFKLPEHHGWTATEGFNVFIADRGAVRLNYPQDWVIKPQLRTVKGVAEVNGWGGFEKQFLIQNYARLPLVLERGKGCWVWDSSGKKYLDFVEDTKEEAKAFAERTEEARKGVAFP